MNAFTTLILTRRDIAHIMTLADYIEAVENAFRRSHAGHLQVPGVIHIAAPDGGFHVKSAACSDAPAYVVVKVNGNFPENPRRSGLPTIQGALLLLDGRNGSLLAVMDSAEITAMRTAAATAVAARHFAPPDTTVATVIGCGIQGPLQLLALLEVLPIDKVFLYDSDRHRSEAAARRLMARRGLAVVTPDDFSDGARESQAIVTATSSRAPFLRPDHVSPGAFVAAIGADSHDKQELDPALLAAGRVVVDVLDQCAEIGELHHAIEAGVMDRSDVFADLGAIVAGSVPVSLDSGDIVVFDSTGTAVQDLASAAVVYERARREGLGVPMALS